MIRQTLEALDSEGLTISEVARRLAIRPEELRVRLDMLEERGYVKKDEGSSDCSVHCGGHCAGCSGSKASPRSTVFMLTEKGRSVLNKI